MPVAAAYASLPLSDSERLTFPHLDYRPDVDGLRAIAVLAVVGAHTAPKLVPGGFAGVDVFFVISGFLISGIILRALSQGNFSCFDFYARRVRRIFPALVVVLVTVSIFGWLILPPDEYRTLGKYIAAGSGFVLNLIIYRDISTSLTSQPMITHLWSLGVEEQFYLLWPIFLITTWKLGIKGQLILIGMATTAAFALNAAVASWDRWAAYLLTWNRLWELSLGSALAYAQVNGVGELKRIRATVTARSLSWARLPSHVRGLIGSVLLVASFGCLNDRMTFPGWWALAPSTGTLLLISAGPRSWVNHYVLGAAPMVFIGLISYPLYLWHIPILVIARTIGSHHVMTPAMTLGIVVTALILAFLTYKYIELPIRSNARKARVTSTLFAAMVVCGSIGYMIFLHGIPPRSESHGASRFVRTAMEDWLPGPTARP